MDAITTKALDILLAKRDDLLAGRPHLQQMQAEIDRLLIHAGPAASRGAALEIMLAASVKQLGDYAASLRLGQTIGPACDQPED